MKSQEGIRKFKWMAIFSFMLISFPSCSSLDKHVVYNINLIFIKLSGIIVYIVYCLMQILNIEHDSV